MYVKATKLSVTLTDEHLACLTTVIAKVNSGILTARLRGGKRKGVLDELTVLRKKTVEVVEREGIKIKENRAMKVETWKLKHPGQDPVAAGFPCRMLKIQGMKHLCVLYRHLPEGHYDLEIESAVETCIKEIVDDGEISLREGQQRHVTHKTTRKLNGHHAIFI